MDKSEQYEDLKLDFAREYVNPENSVGEDCRMLVNQIKITMALHADKQLLKMWLKELHDEVKKIKVDFFDAWNFD